MQNKASDVLLCHPGPCIEVAALKKMCILPVSSMVMFMLSSVAWLAGTTLGDRFVIQSCFLIAIIGSTWMKLKTLQYVKVFS